MTDHQVSFILDGREVQAPPGTTVLEAARKLGHAIPTLCHHPLLDTNGRCGVCTVEREPAVMIRACLTPVEQGAVYHTGSPAVAAHRREVVKLLLSRHELACHTCDRHGECELERLVGRLGITDGSPVGLSAQTLTDRSSASLSLLGDRCLVCGDDIFVTQVDRIMQGIEKDAANCVLIKPNQVGTLTDTFDAVRLAHTHGMDTVMSHRSG
ncbi:MAG: 2Fe-2S iron-sulfur cluster-binding protein, partial [bacterium]|nr:2Fe-2S iron-sulfur cluster-binding protein [bacterium]